MGDWIKCSERVPKIGERVLIPTPGGRMVVEAQRFKGNSFNRFGIEVVANYWMPMPSSPEEA